MKTLAFTPLIPIANLNELKNENSKSGIAILVKHQDLSFTPVCLLNSKIDIYAEIESRLHEFEIDLHQLYVSILFCERLIFYPPKQILVLELDNIQDYIVSGLKLEFQKRFYDNNRLLISDIDIINEYLTINLPVLIDE
jgi:hypothetical protein